MKKILIMVCALALTFGLAACGNKVVKEEDLPASANNETQEPDTQEPETQEPETQEPDTQEPADNNEAEATDVVKESATAYFAEFPDDKHMINVPDLFAKIDAGEEMIIIDIRRPEDYAEGHLKGAWNIPYANVAEFLTKIPDDTPLFVNCYSGQTSSQTVALLNIAGKYATNIQGGFNGGISTTEGYEAYVDTEEVTIPEETYQVDEAIVAAIADYYADATSNTFSSFNFPPESLAELVDAKSEDYTILSIRSAEDYAKGHIEGAINIPFGKGMQERFSEIPTDKPVVVYCYSGQTSSQTMAVLRMLGYEAYSLAGGMGKEGGSGWLGGGFPVVTE